MKVIIAGSREFADYELLKKAMSECGFEVTEVVSGHAPGADALGERWADDNGIPIKPFPAEWEKYGNKAAGPLRNEKMAQYGEALVAFVSQKSKGTVDMIKRARSRNLKVFVVKVKV
jgi:hypothetical protein